MGVWTSLKNSHMQPLLRTINAVRNFLNTLLHTCRHYDVIVYPLGESTSIPSNRAAPSTITNQDIRNGVGGLYVAGRIYDKSATTFQVGGPGGAARKRRALAGT